MLAKYLWRKLKNAMAALTASLERANITSSTDQNISADDLARDTTLTNNNDETVATVNPSVFDNSPILVNFAGMNDCLSLQSLSGRSLMHLMSEESLTSLEITDKDQSYDWMAVCREVSCDNEGYEYAIEDDEDDDYDDDDYNGDDGHYDEDNPNIPEATSSSLLAKYLYLWRKLKNADMAALTASLERANITSSTDQSISAGDLARDTTLTNNHDETVATVNTSVFDDTPILVNFLEDHEPVDIDSVTLVRLVAATSNKSPTTNVPSDITIPSKCEWFAASGRDTSCNPAPKNVSRLEDMVFPSRMLAG